MTKGKLQDPGEFISKDAGKRFDVPPDPRTKPHPPSAHKGDKKN